MVKRFEGSEIVWYAQKSYDALRTALEPVIFNYDEQKFDPYKKLEVEAHDDHLLRLPAWRRHARSNPQADLRGETGEQQPRPS